MKAHFLITSGKCSIAYMGDNLPPGCSGDTGSQAVPPLVTQRHRDMLRACQELAAGTTSSPEGVISEGKEGIEANFLPCCIAKAPNFQPNDFGITPFLERR